jgi:glycosyltransferase (TIGR04182 family)
MNSTIDPKDVCILIPTLNESKTIGGLIDNFQSQGFYNILVIDGNSKDSTVKIAQKKGARVVMQTGHGKGQALRQAFGFFLTEINTKYIIMIDGDGTYLPNEVHLFIEAMEKGAGHVIGDRFYNPGKGAFTMLNYIGNKILNKFFRLAYGKWLSDILSGYRGFTRETISQLILTQKGFEIETEITVECVKNEIDIHVVPITYLPRFGGAVSNLNPLADGFNIGKMIFTMAKINNPLFYFSVIGGVTVLIGIIIGIYVVQQWLNNIEHNLLALLTTLIIISGLQMFVFAMMGDLIVSLHKETKRNIRKLQK